MIDMNFIDTLNAVELVIAGGDVPLVVGESGIGKTALMKKLCERNNYYYITIDGNMLKEGEIGGLPTIDEYTAFVEGKEVKRKRTVYAVHTKLQEIDKVIEEKAERRILLFIDEINRCEHTVQQELMNIILNREINGYILPEEVIVTAAMNPSNKYEDFLESDYQVVDMDSAQEDRFVWLVMEADIKSWLSWGAEEGEIHEFVLEFLSSFPQFLHTPKSSEMVKATPRSWQRVSNACKAYLIRKNQISKSVFLNVLRGNLGSSIAQEFYNFIESNKNPIIKPEEIFANDRFDEELTTRVKNESHSRLYMTARNTLNYIKNLEFREREVKIFSQFLNLYPADLMLAVMKEIKAGYEASIYEEFLQEETFIEAFFKLYNEGGR
jgi:hypothetical protein